MRYHYHNKRCMATVPKRTAKVTKKMTFVTPEVISNNNGTYLMIFDLQEGIK